jgi:hypothetical protein
MNVQLSGSNSGSALPPAHCSCLHSPRPSFTENILSGSRRCSTQLTAASNPLRAGGRFETELAIGHILRAVLHSAPAASAALSHASLPRRCQLSAAVSTANRSGPFGPRLLIRWRPIMTAAAAGQSVTAYQPPIEELAQDAVVWASQHGLVRPHLYTLPWPQCSVAACDRSFLQPS